MTSEPDKAEIQELYEETRNRDVPNWVPEGWRTTVDSWFQRKWPVETWRGIEGHRHHYVAWIFYSLVIAFCLTSPRWWKHAPATERS
jgi:hypothetical protein